MTTNVAAQPGPCSRRPPCLMLLLSLAAAACIEPIAEPDLEGVRVGVLLPYTGDLATVGQNLERAVILANERLEAAAKDLRAEGGPVRPPFRLIFRDTHSDDVTGYAAADELIEQQRVSFIIGPEEPSLAEAMAPLLRDRTVAITGGAVSLDSSTGVNDWFRIVPTAKRMSGVLAQRITSDKKRNLAIIYVQDSYGSAFSTLAAADFMARGGLSVTRHALSPDVSNGDLVRKVVAAKPDSILLVAYPTAGAAVVQEWSILGADQVWYFAPSLRSDVFALNLPPGLLDGMVGISAGLPADARNFAAEFSRRWDGEAPSPNAHYYFDAMMLAGLAHRWAAGMAGTESPTSSQLAAALVAISGPGGTIQTWQDTGPALRAVEAGMEIDYRGTSGAVDFSEDGSVPQGFVQFWTVRDSVIESL